MPTYVAGQSPIYIEWIHPAGTAVLSNDYRRFDFPETVSMIEATAGVDTDESFISSFKRGQPTMDLRILAGGTVIISSLAVGTRGTIRFGPEGSASGKPRTTAPLIVENRGRAYPYNEIAMLTIQFRKNGPVVEDAY